MKKQARVQARIRTCIESYGQALENYERNHPNWRGEALLSLIDYGLRNLRLFIESKHERRITWDSPFVELHYPVDWNWKAWFKDKRPTTAIDCGTLTDANTRNKKAIVKTLAEIMVKHVTVLALQEFTNNVGYEKRGNQYIPILAADVGEFIAQVRSKREKKKILERLYHPFSMGAACIDIDEESLKPDAVVPKSVAYELAKISELIDLPPLEWVGNIDGHQLKISLIFQIHPFVVDLNKRSAHFPITVGLHLLPGDTLDAEELLNLMDESWTNPKNWSRSDQDSFWKQLFEGLHRVARGVAPQPSPEVAEAVISVNAKVKIVGSHADSSATKSAIDKMLKTFSKTGQVIQWDCDANPMVSAVEQLCWSKLRDEDFERLLFNLVSATRGYENAEWLTHTNAADKGRDVSVHRVILDPLSGTRRLRVIIQCKHKKRIGVSEVTQLKEQMALWEPPRVDELIIATSGRFSGDAVQWIEKHNQSNNALRIAMWASSHLERLLAERPYLIAEFRLKQPASG